MKIQLFLGLWLLMVTSPFKAATANQNQPETEAESVGRVLMLFYNHMSSMEKNLKAKTAAEALIAKYPNNPWHYELWCAIVWGMTGLELEMKLEDRQNILTIPPYRKRADEYHRMVEKGRQVADEHLLALTAPSSEKERQKWLFAKASLLFANAKFAARFEGDGLDRDGRAALSKADTITAQAIRELKAILREDPAFSPAYFILGVTQFQFYSQGKWSINGLTIRIKSQARSEMKELCGDSCFDGKEALSWLEKAHSYGIPEPWLRRNWIETTIVLEGAYEKYRVWQGYNFQDEVRFLENRQLPLLLLLLQQFPESNDLAQKLRLRSHRVWVINNHLNKP